MATDVPAYTATTWNPDAAPGISAAELQRIDDQVNALSTEFNIHNGGVSVLDHPVATTGVLGMMSAGDKAKLDTIETGATQDDFDFSSQSSLVANTLLTTTMADHLLFGYGPPGGWGNYKLAVAFSVSVEEIGVVDMQTQLRIDGVDGNIHEVEAVDGDSHYVMTTYADLSGRSGSINVILRGLCQVVSNGIRLRHGFMQVIASRET